MNDRGIREECFISGNASKIKSNFITTLYFSTSMRYSLWIGSIALHPKRKTQALRS